MVSRLPALLFGALVVFAIGLAASGFDPREYARTHGGIVRISIATGNTGGVYYPYGGGLARVISQSVPKVDATAEVTNSSVDNLKLIQLEKADIAFALADSLDDAINGRGPFAKSPVKARTLAVLYPNYMHVATIEGKGIDKLSDLRGHVVSTGSPGSGTEVIAFRQLRAVGIDPGRDIRRQSMTVNAAVDAIKDGKIDAFFWGGGLPTASILDLASTVGITAKLIPNDDVVPTLQSTYSPNLYYRLVVPHGTYPGVTSDVGVVGVSNVLIVHESMSDDLATIHPEAKKLTIETAMIGSPAPFHPGAIRYYQERGVWK